MSGVMRSEVKLESGFTDVQKGITQGLEVLDVVRRNVSVIAATMPNRLYESPATASDEFDRNVIMFAQSTASTSVPMLRTPNVITEELMTAAYIKLQINSIAMTVEKMPTLPATALSNVTPNTVVTFQTTPTVEVRSMSITHLRHHVVRQVINIRDLLENECIRNLSVHEGAVTLNNLSAGLEALGMGQESTLVGKWAITLARSLVEASSGENPNLTATLALNLLNQSKGYYFIGNRAQSLQAVKEAYTITQNLRNHYSGEAHFQILYSDILLQYANLVDKQRSIEMCIEAVQVLEDILGVQAYTLSNFREQIQIVVHPSHGSSFIDNLFSSAPPTTAITRYADVLYKMGTYLAVDGYSESALDLQLLAIAVRRQTVSIHGHEHNAGLALALLQVVQGRNKNRFPAEELVDMADECILILQELAEENPAYYARQLVGALWEKAVALENLDRDSEAIAMWEKVVSLAEQIVQDSELCARALQNLSNMFWQLNRHDDAVRTGRLAINTYQEKAETQAARYFNLSMDLLNLQSYKESAEAVQTSITLYRQAAMTYPRRWMSHLTDALSQLARCLAASGDHSEALIAWKESMRILDSFLNTDTEATSDGINVYLAALRKHIRISFALEDEEKCLIVGLTSVQYLRKLSEIHPQNTDIIQNLMRAEFWYAYNMLRVGRPQDARQYIDHLVDIWSIKPEVMPETSIMTWNVRMMNLKADVLNAQGCTEQALSVTQKLHNQVQPFITTFEDSFQVSEIIKSIVQEALLRANLGESAEAMQTAEGALALSRDNRLEPIINSLAWSLYGMSLTMLSCQNYHRAVEAAQEGCDLLASPSRRLEFSLDSECDSFLRPSLFAILSSAEANLGRYGTAAECARRAVDASLEIREMKAYVSATTAEQSYMETRGNLVEILLATGDLNQARQICEERRAYFSKRVEKRMGDYRELAPILRMLGVLCCSEGHHDEGNTAAQELARIMKTLGSAFPSLQEQVKIRLRRQAKVPILKVISDLSKKLDCGHQEEILSLFEI